ncbi:MAG: DMT family transporter [Pseudomonadota bacterium]
MTQNATRRTTVFAVLAIVASVCALSLGDALIKGTGLALPLWQMFVVRSLLTLLPLWWCARRFGPVRLNAPGWAVLRSVLLVVMWLSYYAALPRMPLSLAAAAYYTGPLFIVALAALVARRWPPMRALVALAGGFVGVLLIVWPDPSGFDVVTLLPLVSAVLYASGMVITAARCQDDNPFVLSLVLNIAFVVGGGVLGLFSGQGESLILGPWQSIDPELFLVLVALAFSIVIGSAGAAYAYQNGPPATIAAFDYCYLVFSLIWGAVFFFEIPDLAAMAGIALIVAAGLLALPSRRA